MAVNPDVNDEEAKKQIEELDSGAQDLERLVMELSKELLIKPESLMNTPAPVFEVLCNFVGFTKGLGEFGRFRSLLEKRLKTGLKK
jgi:hypothetical protein